MVKHVAGGLLIVLSMTGCASMRDREWGSCTVAGAIVGGAIGGVTGGTVVNNADDDPDNTERGAAIGGGLVGGALLGALLGHLICDPVPAEPAPPPVAAPPPAPRKIAELDGANFDFNKSTLRPEGKSRLDTVVSTMKSEKNLAVSIEGHTDSVGSDAYNQRLSQRRAEAAAAYVQSKGIEASRLSTKGWGESKPVADNNTEAGRAKNRRVEVLAK